MIALGVRLKAISSVLADSWHLVRYVEVCKQVLSKSRRITNLELASSRSAKFRNSCIANELATSICPSRLRITTTIKYSFLSARYLSSVLSRECAFSDILIRVESSRSSGLIERESLFGESVWKSQIWNDRAVFKYGFLSRKSIFNNNSQMLQNFRDLFIWWSIERIRYEMS